MSLPALAVITGAEIEEPPEPLKKIVFSSGDRPNPDPFIVTVLPTGPSAGLMLVICTLSAMICTPLSPIRSAAIWNTAILRWLLIPRPSR